jgi:hypothetical protein
MTDTKGGRIMRTKRAMLHNLSLVAIVTLALLMTADVTRAADLKKPNILIIWGDDIGYWNLSAYNQGMMGYKTPNITASPGKARSSPTGIVNKVVPPGYTTKVL